MTATVELLVTLIADNKLTTMTMMITLLCICPADTYEVCHVATKLPATQSSVYTDPWGRYTASLANDGSRRTNFGQFSCSASNLDTNPWWVVDLGIPLTVTGVLFTNRDLAGACTIFNSIGNISSMGFDNILTATSFLFLFN